MAPKAASRFRNAFINNVHRHMQRADELGRLTTDVGQLSVWLEIISDRIVAIETQWSDLDRLRLAGSPISCRTCDERPVPPLAARSAS